MIFHNPRGGVELGCDECGCRWFDRHSNTCYECGAPVSAEQIAEYQRAVAEFHAAKGIEVNGCASTTSSSSEPAPRG